MMYPLKFAVLGFGLSAMAASGISRAQSPADDAEQGKGLFQNRCALCHAVDSAAASQGPSLGGVMNRRAASTPGFAYSKELRASGLVWGRATLDRYLAGPSELVPGTLMPVNVPDANERRALLAYLATLPEPRAGSTDRNAGATDGRAEVGTSNAAQAEGWRSNKPGHRHKILVSDLLPPFASAASSNAPRMTKPPVEAKLSAPPGFTVSPFASGLKGPRVVRVAPNGDVFVAETRAGRLIVMSAKDGKSRPVQVETFVAGLSQPFGIEFYPPGANPKWVYVANINSVVRFPYRNGDLTARGAAETVIEKLSGTTGGHTSRDLAFSKDGRQLFVSVGSGSNVAEGMEAKSAGEVRAWEMNHILGSTWGSEENRADVLVSDPDGRHVRVFATGIRNCAGLSTNPTTGELWCATNERDNLGDDLVPDYITHVRENAFYGWPWYYLGSNPDPRKRDARPDLANRVTAPDVLLQAHSAALQLTFYPASSGVAAFPAEYRGDAFVALHGSWNRSVRTGYKVVRAFMKNGIATGEYEDFLTGFVVNDESVWGRPVGVAVAHDGALLVTDDASDTLWRVAYDAATQR